LITPNGVARASLFGVMALRGRHRGTFSRRLDVRHDARRLGADVVRGWTEADVGILILALVCVPLPADYVTICSITNIDSDPTGSAQGRWERQAAAVGYASHPPVGAGSARTSSDEHGARTGLMMVHNAYLEYAIDLGLPGLVLFLLLIVGCVRSAGRAARLGAARPGGRAERPGQRHPGEPAGVRGGGRSSRRSRITSLLLLRVWPSRPRGIAGSQRARRRL
jgi:hypothetical protein